MDNNFSNAHKALENSNLPDMSAGFNKSIDSDQQDSHLEWMKFSAEHVFRDEPSYGAKFPFERFPAYENPSPIEVDSLVTFGFAEKYIRLQQSTYKTLKKQKKNEEKSISLSSRKTKKNNIYTENQKKNISFNLYCADPENSSIESDFYLSDEIVTPFDALTMSNTPEQELYQKASSSTCYGRGHAHKDKVEQTDVPSAPLVGIETNPGPPIDEFVALEVAKQSVGAMIDIFWVMVTMWFSVTPKYPQLMQYMLMSFAFGYAFTAFLMRLMMLRLVSDVIKFFSIAFADWYCEPPAPRLVGIEPNPGPPTLSKYVPEGGQPDKKNVYKKTVRKSNNARPVNKKFVKLAKDKNKEFEAKLRQLRDAKLETRYECESFFRVTVDDVNGMVDTGPEITGILRSFLDLFKSLKGWKNIKVEHKVNFGIQDFFVSFYKWLSGLAESAYVYIKAIFKCLVACMPSKFIDFYNAVFSFISPDMVLTVDLEKIYEYDGSYVPEAFPSVIPSTVFSTIWVSCLKDKCISKESWMQFTETISSFKKDEGAITSFFGTIWRICKEIAIFICDVFNLDVTWFSANTRVRAISEKAKKLRDKFRIGEEVGYDFAREVFELEDEMEAVLLLKTDMSPFVKERLKYLSDKFRPIIDHCTRSINPNDGPRLEPTNLLIGGCSGVGKSSITQPILLAFLTNVLTGDQLEVLKRPGGHNDLVHYRATETEYWEGHRRTKIALVYDDFGQVVDAVGSPSVDAFEMIRLKNTAPYHLHFASIEKKESEYARPVFMMGTTNRQILAFNSIVSSEAVCRRIDVGVMQCPKKEYSLNPSDPPNTRKMDLAKVRRDFPFDERDPDSYFAMDVIEFHEWNFLTGTLATSGKVHDFDSLITKLVDTHKVLNTKGNTMIAYHETMKNYVLKRDRPVEESFEPEMFYTIAKSISAGATDVVDVMSKIASGDIKSGSVGKKVQNVVEACAPNLVGNQKVLCECYVSAEGRGKPHAALLKEASDKCSCNKLNEESMFGKGVWKKFVDGEAPLTGYDKMRAWLELVAEEKAIKYNPFSGPYRERNAAVIAALTGFGCLAYSIYKYVKNVDDVCQTVQGYYPETSYHKREVTVKGKSSKRVMLSRTARRDAKFAARFEAESAVYGMEACFSTYLRNTYVLIVRGKPVGKVLFFAGRHFLMPKHFQDYILSPSDEDEGDEWEELIEFRNPASENICFVLDYAKDVESHALSRFDLVLCHVVSDKIRMHKNLVPFFFSSKEVSRFDHNYTSQMIVERSNKLVALTFPTNFGKEIRYGDGDYVSRELHYKTSSLKGDCGSFLMVEDTRFDGPRILGIHTAGEENKAGVKGCVGVLITREELESYMHNTFGDVSSSLLGEEVFEYAPEGATPIDGFAVIGQMKQPRLPKSTSIVQSKLHGKLWDITTKPANLRPFYFDGQLIDPAAIATKKYAHNEVYIDMEVLTHAAWLVGNTIFREYTNPPHRPRKFTFEEAVGGIDGVDYVDAISRSTSAGVPFVHDPRTKTRPGKSLWFGSEGPVDFSTSECGEIRDRVSFVIDSAKKGVRLKHVYFDFLKDERRPLEKVDAGKSRQIACCPLDFLICVKMYFGDFIRHTTANRMFNGVAVGMDHATEWTALVKYMMREKDYRFTAGDFSAYDGRIPVPIGICVLRMINDWYGGSDEDNRVREILFQEVINSRHLREGSVYEFTGGNPSGNPLTAIFNSICQLIMITYVAITIFILKGGDIRDFKDEVYEIVRMIVYGDDGAYSYPKRLEYMYGQTVLESAYPALLNMKYTNESKVMSVDGSRSIEQITFLKRGFRFEMGAWHSPLELGVIKETLCWERKNANEKEMILRVETALTEFARHGREVFSAHANRLIKASIEAYGYDPLNKTYRRALEANGSFGF